MSIREQTEALSAQQEVARNSNVLYDPALVTAPQQVMPFLRAFFGYYSPAKRAEYDAFVHERSVAKMAAKLQYYNANSTEPILVNQEYYKVWDESSQKIADWFALNGELNPDPPPAAPNVTQRAFQRLAEWDALYDSYNSQLVNVRAGIIDTLTQQDIALHELRLAEMGAAVTDLGARRTARLAEHNADLATVQELRAKYGIGAPAARMNIGAPGDPAVPTGIVTSMSAVEPGVARLGFVTPAVAPAKTAEKAAAEKYDAIRITGDGKDNFDRVVTHYEDLIKRVGAYMLALFRAMSFPAVIAIRAPAFTEKWEQIIDTAYDRFAQMAAARSKAARNPRERAIDWQNSGVSASALVNLETLRSFFAEYIGYRLTIFPMMQVPQPQVTITNRRVDDAAHMTSLMFLNLYNAVVAHILDGVIAPAAPLPEQKRRKIIGTSMPQEEAATGARDWGAEIRVEAL